MTEVYPAVAKIAADTAQNRIAVIHIGKEIRKIGEIDIAFTHAAGLTSGTKARAKAVLSAEGLKATRILQVVVGGGRHAIVCYTKVK